MGLRRNINTEEARAYWRFIDETAAEVATWPCWKRGCPGCSECDENRSPIVPPGILSDKDHRKP